MKHSLNYLDKAIILLISTALIGCASRKSVNHEQQEKVELQAERRAEDLNVLEYSIDTTRECEQSLDFERVEFYPTTYTDSAGRVVQHVKAITKKSAKATNKARGTSNALQVEQHTDTASAVLKTDVKTSTTYKERTVPWQLGVFSLAFLFIIIMLFIFKVRKQ